MTATDRNSGADRWTLTACLAAALAVRVLGLGGADLWSDEVHTLRSVALPLGQVTGERLHAGHVPLYFFLLKAWTAVFGVSQTSIRLPSALFGTAALLPAWALFRRLLGAAPARWAVALVAVHPVLVELSREARMYSLLGLAFLVLAEGAVAATDDGRVPWRFWAAAAIGPLIHPSWAFGVLPLAGWVLCCDAVDPARRATILRRPGRCDRPALPFGSRASPALGTRRGVRTRLVAGLAASLVLLLLALATSNPQHQVLTRRAWPAEIAVFLLRPYLSSRPEAWFPTAGLALVAWAAALVTAWRVADRRGRAFGVALAVGVPLVSAAVGVAAGLPWGPARYVQCATFGAIALAAAAGSMPAPAPAPDPAAPARQVVRTFRATVGALARGFLVASLFLLTLMVVGRPDTTWSDAGARVVRDVPAGETVWVDDESAALLLGHYAGDRYDVRVGRPEDGAGGGAAHWRARLVPDPIRPVVEVAREP